MEIFFIGYRFLDLAVLKLSIYLIRNNLHTIDTPVKPKKGYSPADEQPFSSLVEVKP